MPPELIYSFIAWVTIKRKNDMVFLAESGINPALVRPHFKESVPALLKTQKDTPVVWMSYPKTYSGEIKALSLIRPLKPNQAIARRERFLMQGVVTKTKRYTEDSKNLILVCVQIGRNEAQADRKPFTTEFLLQNPTDDPAPENIPKTTIKMSRTRAQFFYHHFCKVEGVISGGRLFAETISAIGHIDGIDSNEGKDFPLHKITPPKEDVLDLMRNLGQEIIELPASAIAAPSEVAVCKVKATPQPPPPEKERVTVTSEGRKVFRLY